jgi:hypothetical protein
MNGMKMRDDQRGQAARFALITAAALSLAACVQVKAPDRPIEINLNIRIEQEIVYKLDGDAKKLIEQNTGIF